MAESTPSPKQQRLVRALSRLSPNDLRRGRGAHALHALRGRLDGEDVDLDPELAELLADVVESAGYAIDDARAEARRNLRVTSRTIGAASRRGGR